MANRLANETSPYLLQHAHNPVDWYPWGDEAFDRARNEGKPILLSIGYSACHWCHVMERESFEDDATARVMNELFVNIKVDREERPDVDGVYMQAVQAMNGHGGWPMTVFLTPELVPFWAGTYFPPQDRQGMPSFQRVMRAVWDAYTNRPDDVARVASSMRQMYSATRERARASGAITHELLDRATASLLASHDREHGGFGSAPKFPHAMAMEFLLNQWARTGNEAALEAARSTFVQMARGGIYDQVGGGFARYSVDERWLVPHFEKMLYDNALLTRLGVHLWQITRDDEIRRVCEETIDWLAREMTSPEGGFYSTLDADSEGEEGRFYVWDAGELREALGDDADEMLDYWGVSEGGNFEGRNILHVASRRRVDPAVISRSRRMLYERRAKRVWPGRDEKILASWNGLMTRAVAEAARAFGRSDYRKLGIRNGEFLFREMLRDGRVYRTRKDGRTRIPGFLEDAAALGLAAIALYELTFDAAWLDRAREMSRSVVNLFWDEERSAFFDTAGESTELPSRPRDFTDNATPSGTSLAVELLWRVGDVTGDSDAVRRAGFVLETVAEPMKRYPLAFGHALTVADMAVHGAIEVALVGEGDELEALKRVVDETFVPSLILAGSAEGAAKGASPGRVAGSAESASPGIALLADRETIDGVATAFVCRGFVCERPVTKAVDLLDGLERARRRRDPD